MPPVRRRDAVRDAIALRCLISLERENDRAGGTPPREALAAIGAAIAERDTDAHTELAAPARAAGTSGARSSTSAAFYGGKSTRIAGGRSARCTGSLRLTDGPSGNPRPQRTAARMLSRPGRA